MKRVRVRYAPSPTGHLHIGGARTALFNYLFAKHHGGDFLFRLEDTDIERNIEHGEASQLENLAWLGIIPDESPINPGHHGPYRQMERLDLYQAHTQQLLDQGHAYKCFCTTEVLDLEREKQMAAGVAPMYTGTCRNLTPEQIQANEAVQIPFTVRMRVPHDVTYVVEDLVGGHVTFESSDIGDWVLVKANGIPTYNYAVVVDDHLMEISHVFRGEEHLSNTPKQLMLYDAFNYEAPVFGHMTLIVNEERKKLSKRDESIIQFISQYRELGFLPEAMFNFIALLGWSPGGEEEIFNKETLIKIFDEHRLSKSPSMFDTAKLNWVNNRYIKTLSIEDTVSLCLPYLKKAYDLTTKSNDWITLLIETYHDQLSYGKEIVELASLFFNEDNKLNETDTAFMAQPGVDETVRAFKEAIEATDVLSIEAVKAAMNTTKEVSGAKGKMLFMPLRLAVTRQMHGPDFASVVVLLGKEKVLARLNSY